MEKDIRDKEFLEWKKYMLENWDKMEITAKAIKNLEEKHGRKRR